MEQSLDILNSSMRCFRKVFIILDALDEHGIKEDGSPRNRSRLLTKLLEIQQDSPSSFALLVTSRDDPQIYQQLSRPNLSKIETQANKEDIESYVRSYINNSETFSSVPEVRTERGLADTVLK